MMDGTFQNTKLFKGEYNVRIDGPFIPLVREIQTVPCSMMVPSILKSVVRRK